MVVLQNGAVSAQQIFKVLPAPQHRFIKAHKLTFGQSGGSSGIFHDIAF